MFFIKNVKLLAKISLKEICPAFVFFALLYINLAINKSLI